MNGAPIASSQLGGCLWTAGGEMVCTKQAKKAYQRTEKKEKNEIETGFDDVYSDSDDGAHHPNSSPSSSSKKQAKKESFVSEKRKNPYGF